MWCTDLWCRRFRIHPYVAASLIHLHIIITKLTMLCKGVSYTNLCRILEIEFLGVFSIQVMTQPRLTYQQHASFHHKIKRRRLLCTFSHTNSRYSHHFFFIVYSKYTTNIALEMRPYDLYPALCVMLLMRAASITWASGWGLGPGNLEFFGLQMALVYRLDAVSKGLKNSQYPGPNPLPLALVMDAARIKSITREPYKS